MTFDHPLAATGHALGMIGTMAWTLFWALNLGFLMSAIVDVLISKAEMKRLLPDDSPRSIAIATGLGAASSSCSYAAVAISRSMFRKGADFTAAMAFQIASTNLVLELGILLVVMLGWPFAVAEFIGGPLMIVLMAMLFRLFLRKRAIEAARRRAETAGTTAMSGHADMATMVRQGSWKDRLASREGWTLISHYYVMNWQMLWKEILVGLLIAGALGAWVPDAFWHRLFLSGNPTASMLWGPMIGQLIAVASFTCSIGNVPLAAVLWNGGLSFGGVLAFIFADLIILPILNIYRKVYGLPMMAFLTVTFAIAMFGAALAVDAFFSAVGWVPATRSTLVITQAVRWNYTTILNLLSLMLAIWLSVRFVRTGGPQMMRDMEASGHCEHGHHPHDHAGGHHH